MRYDTSQMGAKAPKGGHLAVLTNSKTMEVQAIQPGNVMFIIDNPTRVDSVMPLVLTQVDRHGITFKCGCGQPQCSRKVQFKAKWAGHHPPVIPAR